MSWNNYNVDDENAAQNKKQLYEALHGCQLYNGQKVNLMVIDEKNWNKSSAVAEMGDRGHNSVGCHSST